MLCRRHDCSGRRRDDRGASAIEMAFIAPVLILVIFFGIQAALFYYGRNVAIQSAREGLSQMRLAQDQATFDAQRGDIVDHTESFAHSVGHEALIDAIATPSYDDQRGRVSMTVAGRVITLVPGLHLTVSETADGSVERFEAPSGEFTNSEGVTGAN